MRIPNNIEKRVKALNPSKDTSIEKLIEEEGFIIHVGYTEEQELELDPQWLKKRAYMNKQAKTNPNSVKFGVTWVD